MFPGYLSVFFFGLTAFCLWRDRRVRRYLFSTAMAALTLGYTVLQWYALFAALDNGLVVANQNWITYLDLAEIVVSVLLLVYVLVRAAKIELPNELDEPARKKKVS